MTWNSDMEMMHMCLDNMAAKVALGENGKICAGIEPMTYGYIKSLTPLL